MPARLIFFLSGGAALLYQVIWQRLLVFFSGADVYSITIIVAAFMCGLGLGSLAGGRLADRLGARASLWAFAAAELGIGAFGLVSKTLYYDVLYGRFPHLASTPAIAAAVLLVGLLAPTFLMGVSLPLLSRALTPNLAASGRIIGSLYGWNTLGAATGALVGTWLLVPRFGLEGSLWIAAGVNVWCAAAALWLGLAQGRQASDSASPAEAAREPAVSARSLSFTSWALIYGLTGFIALGLEIAWFRLLGVLLKSTAFTFGTLLAVYLGGLGLGAVVAARRVSRSNQPGAIFLLLQYALTIYAAAGIILLTAMLGAGMPAKLVIYVADYEPLYVFGVFEGLRALSPNNLQPLRSLFTLIGLYVLLPAALIGPPTFLMGVSFPYLQQAVQSDLPRIGRRLGTLLAMNILGAVLGAMLAGWVLLPWLGTAGTLRVLVALGVLLAVPFGLVAWPGQRRRVAPALAAVLITGTAVVLMPTAETLWARLHGIPASRMLFGEDGAGLSVLKADGGDFTGPVTVYVNGLGQSTLPYGGLHTQLGLLPALIHSAPTDILVIGLGSGDTLFGAAARADVQRVVAVEIIGAQRDTLEQLARMRAYPGLVAVLADPRIEHRAGDGRAFLLQSTRRFDIIEADALRPTSAYAGNLYSREYFALLSRRLKPGGMAVTWAPTERVRHTFLSVFPHAMAFGELLIGSNEPIPFDRQAIGERAEALTGAFAAAGMDVMSLERPLLRGTPVVFGPGGGRADTVLNTDLFPRDEFALPYTSRGGTTPWGW